MSTRETDTNISTRDVLSHLQSLLSIPVSKSLSDNSTTLTYAPANDPLILSCCCIVSERLVLETNQVSQLERCPVCEKKSVYIIGLCQNLVDLYQYYAHLKYELEKNNDMNMLEVGSASSYYKGLEAEPLFSNPSPTRMGESKELDVEQTSSQKGLSFLGAFHDALKQINVSSSCNSHELSNNSIPNSQLEDNYSNMNINTNPHSPTNHSIASSASLQRQKTRQLPGNTSNLTKLLSNTSGNSKITTSKRHSNKEYLLSKNFPFFRRIYTHSVSNSNFFLKTKVYIQPQISPNLTKFVLLSEKKWEVYSLDTEKPEKQPKLLCCGKSDASYGTSYESLNRMTKTQIIENSNINNDEPDISDILSDWEHLYCKLTENYLFITGTRGVMRVIDLNRGGLCAYTYKCNFPIRCLDASTNDEYVSLGINGKDKYTQVEQAVIILIKLIPETLSSAFRISTYHFTLPYRDPIGILRFSPDSSLLAVSTVLESRFLVISLLDPWRPTLVMKSQRRIDTSLDSEGITDMSFFPDNRLMTVVSLSQNSEPIIIDTNIASISSPDDIAKPKLLLKVDEVGSTIHACCVSPRGDSVAFINRNGSVYIMTAPRMDDNDNKRVSLVLEVANAPRAKEAASIKFDSDGYKLYALDRRGTLSIADFTAGTVEDHSVTRCKILA